MLSRKQISTLLIIATVVFILVQLTNNKSLSALQLLPFGITVGVLTVAVWLFNEYLWAHTPFKYLLNKPRPNLNGTWPIKIQSQWKEFTSDPDLAPISAFIVIKQNASSMSVTCLTPDSRSRSMTAIMDQKDDGSFEIYAVYQNVPDSIHRETSPIHFGALVLRYSLNSTDLLKGEYWTDRGTKGELIGEGKKSTKILHHYADCVDARAGRRIASLENGKRYPENCGVR